MVNSRHPRLLRLIVTAGAVLCTIAAFGSAAARLRAASPWDGYLVVSAPAEIPDAVFAEGLAARGFSEPLTLSTAKVAFDAFGAYDYAALSELPSRLDPLDPRYDGYLRKLPGLFLTGDRRYAYIRRNDAPPVPSLALMDFPGVELVSSGISALSLVLSLLPMVVGISALLFVGRGDARRFRRGIPFIPFISAAAFGPAAAAAAGIVFVALERLRIWYRDRAPLSRLLSAPFPWAALSFLVLGIGAALWASLSLLALTACVAAWGLVVVLLENRNARRALHAGHRPFMPLSMLPRAPYVPFLVLARRGLPFALSGIVAALALGLAAQPASSGRSAADFVPVPLDGRSAAAGRYVAIVSFDDYRGHRAYQSAFFQSPLNGTAGAGTGRRYAAGPDGLPVQSSTESEVRAEPEPTPVDRLLERQGRGIYAAPAYSVSPVGLGSGAGLLGLLILCAAGTIVSAAGRRGETSLELSLQKRVAA